MMFSSSRSSSPIRGLLSVLCLVAAFATTAHGCTSPSPTNPAVCPAGPGSCSSTSTAGGGTVFGIPEAKLARTTAAVNAALGLRGGKLHEPKTLEDTNALILRAGSSGQLVVIDFTATWCGPCQAIAPLYKNMSDTYDDVVFLKVDVDDNAETAQHYSVSAMPTFLLIKGGVVLERVMGANAERLMSFIEQHK
mmetsp:Transcript_4751/g.10447  ORF Transcript_4751/g.10447 Transcript_4751/m.10447 type:complete len:193 (-) Transcript_4751:1258-1836(-)